MNKSKKQGKSSEGESQRPAQEQKRQPGREYQMEPRPASVNPAILGSNRLAEKVAFISGGDSGIGRACAASFAREGADVAIIYLEEDADARETQKLVKSFGRSCITIRGDIVDPRFCRQAVEQTIEVFGQLDILVNNAAEQHPQTSFDQIMPEQLDRTFRTNVFSMFYLTQAAVPYLKKQEGATIINTTSVTAYRGSPNLIDYSATKGAIVSFTRSLSQQLATGGIRVNAVAPGPIWTPLIPATFKKEKVKTFGSDTPLGRAGEPWECAECYVFLASVESSYVTGQVIHPNGGEIING